MFRYFLKREIQNKYLGSSSALFWMFFQPILILMTYNFVFSYIFKARVPEVAEGNFIAYLAVGLWPWMAFSESILRSITAVTERKDLLDKVKFDHKVLIYSSVSSLFILHLIGYFFVLITLIFLEKLTPNWSYFLLLIPLVSLYLLALSIAFLLSALHVFWKDIQPIMHTLMLLLFFTTPIIYSISVIPEKYHKLININPLIDIFNLIHGATIKNIIIDWSGTIIWLLILPILFVCCRAFFNKLSPAFDDYV